MANDVKKYSIYLIAIVAIVAVVGIVVMTTNYGGFSGFSGTSDMTSEETSVSDGSELSLDLTGKAINLAAYWACMKTDGCNDLFKQYKKTNNKSIKLKYVECSKNCKLKAEQPQQSYCTDSDGSDIYTKGTVVSNNYPEGKEDVCYTFNNGLTQLLEGVCKGIEYQINYINCEGGCYNGACTKTCAPGPTGKGNCTGDKWNNFYYQTEYQYNNCTTYLKNESGNYCGYTNSLSNYSICQDNIGCCKTNIIKTECQGNTLYNQTKNSCTGELKDWYMDCSQKINWYTKQPDVCSSNQFVSGCVTNCNEGEVVYGCYTHWKGNVLVPEYLKLTCTVFSSEKVFDKYWKGYDDMYNQYYEPTCPVGATCYNPEGKCA